MSSSSTLLYNAMIVTMDPETRVFRNGAILIEGDIIKEIGQSSELFQQHQDDSTVDLIDLQGQYILPGLINAHVHTSLHLSRGVANDTDLVTFLNNRSFPFEAQMTEEDSYFSTIACGIELIKSGVTTFAEGGGVHIPGMARAVEELGIRGCLTRSNFDAQNIPGVTIPAQLLNTTDECINSQIELHRTYNGTADGRIRIWFGIRQVTGSTDELLTRTRDAARELNTGVHMHVGEISFENQFIRDTKGVDGGTVTYMNQIQLLGDNFLAAVAVWVSEPEIQLLASAKACAVHCPSNSMHYFGFAPVKQMLDAGLTVALGTDGPSNDRVSMVDEMYMAALINKAIPSLTTAAATDPSILPAETILRMVTIDGAKSLLWDNEIGSLEVGKKADLIVVNPFHWAMSPVNDSIASLVYSMRTENIESVMCNGRWIMRNKQLLTVTEDYVAIAASASSGIMERAGITIPTRMNFV